MASPRSRQAARLRDRRRRAQRRARRLVVLSVLAVLGVVTLLFTAFGSPFWSARPDHPVAALPLQIFQYAISPYDEWHRLAWAGSLVLIGLVLAVNLAARFLIRSPYRT